MVKASLKNYRQSPRKVRLIAGLIRGKKVDRALVILKNASKRAAFPVRKLIESAVANAKNDNLSSENLVIKKITVDGGATLFRRRPRARGAAFVVRKRTSHLGVELEGIEATKTKTEKKK